MSIQLLVILVPVLFGMMGFAIDLGRLWLVRAELHQAASAMALAAASQMSGATASAIDNINNAANQALNEAEREPVQLRVDGDSGRDDHLLQLHRRGVDERSDGATDCGAADVAAIQASISVPAPLLFWSLLPGGADAHDYRRVVRGGGYERAAVHRMRDRADRRVGDRTPGISTTSGSCREAPIRCITPCAGTPPQPLAGGGP